MTDLLNGILKDFVDAIVSFVNADPLAPAYTVSNKGTSALVHVTPDSSGALPELPVLGAYVTVKAGIEAGRLTQTQLSAAGAPYTHVELEGIGAGNQCDAQVLVWSDMAGMNRGRKPKFVKPYADVGAVLLDAARRYAADVRGGEYPDLEHSYS